MLFIAYDTKNNSFTDLLKYMDKRSATSSEQFPLISTLRIVLVSTPIAFARSFCVCLEDFLLSRMMFATAISKCPFFQNNSCRQSAGWDVSPGAALFMTVV